MVGLVGEEYEEQREKIEDVKMDEKEEIEEEEVSIYLVSGILLLEGKKRRMKM